MILMIILIFSFTTGITANSYGDQQFNQLNTATNNTKQNCSLTSKLAVILMILASLLCTPPVIYQIYGGIWSITSVFSLICDADITIKTCCEADLYFKPSDVYRMQWWWGEKWNTTTSVFCDTQTADGGWMVIQRRKDGSVDFNRPWSDYEKGFGNLNGEIWYGLKNMNYLTETGQWELRIDFEFKNNTKSYLHYNVFKVGSAIDKYPLTISGFTGITPTDPFTTGGHNGQKFSTYDNDNDNSYGNCAKSLYNGKGGWWYNDCYNINPNTDFGRQVIYLANIWYYPKWIEMKIRPL